MLTNLKTVLQFAEEHKVALGAFNTPCFESLDAVIQTAERWNMPVIIEHAEVHFPQAPLDRIGPVMVDYARRAAVPVCVHLDHGTSEETIRRAVELGFTSVMYDGSALSYEENVAETRRIAELVHARDVSIEAELGCMSTTEQGGGHYTDPDFAKDFVSRTGVDALAIAFGTAHGIYRDTPVLNFDIIRRVREKAPVPLVMHGGSGVSEEGYRESIACGIRKINYYSYMGAAAYQKAGAYAAAHPEKSRLYQELAWEATQVMETYVENAMRMFAPALMSGTPRQA